MRATLIAPSLVGRLLPGEALDVVAVSVSAVAGIVPIGLGVAYWPGTPRLGTPTCGAGVTVCLAFLGLTSGAHGVLLWPAVIQHTELTAFPVRPGPRS